MPRRTPIAASGLAALFFVLAASCLRKPQSPPATAETPVAERPALAPRPLPAQPGVNVPAIKVDTAGYPSQWKKLAIFNVDPSGAVVRALEGTETYSVTEKDIVHFGKDAASGDEVWQVDFSVLSAPGRYVIEKGTARSDPFEIGPNVYYRALVAGLKHFYFQRCRTALVPPYAVWEGDSYTRQAACHVHQEVAWDLTEHPEKKTRWKPEAGWHDAGNFEMYVPSTAPTAQALLMAYESHPELFQDMGLNIPESSNKIPDLLDEAKWGLVWVLSLQDPGGGFRNREAVMKWSQHGPADGDTAEHWISGVGTASTAKACAALSVAARVYRSWDPEFAAKCEQAARKGWEFLDKHPERIVVDGKGSGQPLWDDGAEHKSEGGARLMAAAEMYRSFREPAALEKVKTLMSDPQARVDEFLRGAWVNMARWGLITLASDPEVPAEIRTEATARIRQAAEKIKAIAEKDGYRVASELSDYYWGSNSNLLERTHLLLAAYRLDPSLAWALQTARDQWHWVLGRNPNGYSMVTRVGKGPTRLYHLEWGRKENPPPGILVGGPNSKDGGFLAPGLPAKALLWDNPEPISAAIPIPAHAMWHSEQEALWAGGFVRKNQWDTGWWVVSEGDIYYNANLVLVGTEMQAPLELAAATAPPKTEQPGR